MAKRSPNKTSVIEPKPELTPNPRTKWSKICAQLTAALHDESPAPPSVVLDAMLAQAKVALEWEIQKITPAMRKHLELKHEALCQFAEILLVYTNTVKARDQRREQMGPGARSEKKPDGRCDAFINGVQCTFSLFDILLSNRQGGIVDGRAIYALLSRQAKNSIAAQKRLAKRLPRYHTECPEWRRLADELRERDPEISDTRAAKQIAARQARSAQFAFNVIRRGIKRSIH